MVRPAVDWISASVERRRAGRGPLTTEYREHRPNRAEFFREVRERGLDVRFGLAIAAIHLLLTAPLSALAAVVMRRVLLRSGFGLRPSLWLALLYAFGTPTFFRTGHLSHNLLVAHGTLFAFALLQRPGGAEGEPRRLAAAGALLGFGVLCDYSGVVPLVALGLFCFAKLVQQRGAREAVKGTAWLAAGVAGPLAALVVYDAWAFGTPFLPAQAHMPATPLSVYGLRGFDWPAVDLLWANLVDPRFGLLSFGPILALALFTPWLVRRGTSLVPAADIALALGLALALLVFTAANQYSRLQWNTGFRMLAPAVPLLFLAATAVLVRLPRPLAIALGALAVAQAWCIAMIREGAWQSVVAVARDGPTLPWLTVLWKMGDTYAPFLQHTGPQALPLFVLAGAAVALLWRRPRPAAGA